MGASGENFCLRWNDFQSNVSSSFRELRNDSDFFDVTLATSDSGNRTLQAHKVILSACSDFFKNILRQQTKLQSHPNPLIYLRGVNHSDLVTALDFMYHGEVNIVHDDLTSFLAVAEELQIKGLTNKPESESRNQTGVKSIRPSQVRDPGPPPKRIRKSSPAIQVAPVLPSPSPLPSTSQDVDESEEINNISVKMDPEMIIASDGDDPVVMPEDGYDESYGDYYDDVSGGMEGDGNEEDLGDGSFAGSKGSSCEPLDTSCLLCNKKFSSKRNAKRHFKEQHLGSERKRPIYQCPVCNETPFVLKRLLNDHVMAVHGFDPNFSQF